MVIRRGKGLVLFLQSLPFVVFRFRRLFGSGLLAESLQEVGQVSEDVDPHREATTLDGVDDTDHGGPHHVGEGFRGCQHLVKGAQRQVRCSLFVAELILDESQSVLHRGLHLVADDRPQVVFGLGVKHQCTFSSGGVGGMVAAARTVFRTHSATSAPAPKCGRRSETGCS